MEGGGSVNGPTEPDELQGPVYFGHVGKSLPDWREYDNNEVDDEIDDEQLSETPPEIVSALGFDPLEIDGTQAEQSEQPKE